MTALDNTAALDSTAGARPAWHARAACTGLPLAWFFAEGDDPATRAQDVCSRCPVRRECLDYALAHGIKFGVWGGLAPKQRRALGSRDRRRRVEAAFVALRATAG